MLHSRLKKSLYQIDQYGFGGDSLLVVKEILAMNYPKRRKNTKKSKRHLMWLCEALGKHITAVVLEV